MELKYKNWMVTILSDKEGTLRLPDKHDVKALFDEIAEKWVYQEETHENAEIAKTHYQCCISTKIRTRQMTLLKKLSESLSHPIERIRVDRMIGTWDQAYIYCSKEDTRVGSTEYSVGLENSYKYEDIALLEDPQKRFPWQHIILSEFFTEAPYNLTPADDRSIYWITDLQGCSGKSLFTKFLCARNDSIVKLSFATAAQLRASVVGLGARRMYIIDIPRTLGNEDSINDLLSAIEDLKNGFVVSSFYGTYGKLFMSPPHILIFSNRDCPIEKLSPDRWKAFNIVGDKTLIEVPTLKDFYHNM